MKPLPAQPPAHRPHEPANIPSLPTMLAPAPPASFSKANRRTHTSASQRAYPWLLCTSTALAAAFCLLYITKPVISAASSADPTLPPHPNTSSPLAPAPAQPATPVPVRTSTPDLLPHGDRLPGEHAATTARPLPATPRQAAPFAGATYEETNLRVQHVLNAEAPGGHLSRIDIDVPVLYQSRNLRWTASELAEARILLARLNDYQEKSRALRSEGVELLDAWNQLVERSIPDGQLRADSPTLPTNQQDAADSPLPAGLNTTEAIQIQPAAP